MLAAWMRCNCNYLQLYRWASPQTSAGSSALAALGTGTSSDSSHLSGASKLRWTVAGEALEGPLASIWTCLHSDWHHSSPGYRAAAAIAVPPGEAAWLHRNPLHKE